MSLITALGESPFTATIESVKESCPKTGHAHAWQLLGREDDGKFAHRCGNCDVPGLSEEEKGEPVPIRADVDAVAVSAKE